LKILLIIACIAMIKGSLDLLGVSLTEFSEWLVGLFQQEKKLTLKDKVEKVQKNKKEKGLKPILEETQKILESTNKSGKFSTICVTSMIAMVIGVIIAISIENWTLVPVLAIGFSLIPFWYVKLVANKWRKQISNELETGLSVITSSYIRSENIITAIDENVSYLNPPISDIFKRFLMETRLINSNVKLAIEKLKTQIDNDVFREWCDALIACQDDKNLKNTLLPIVNKLSDMRLVSGELEQLLYEPLKEVITMSILVIANVPILYFLNKDWYGILVYNPVGKFILSFSIVSIFISIAAAIKHSKPLDYKR